MFFILDINMVRILFFYVRNVANTVVSQKNRNT
uniref:Uncharacterized protein n=1 Tax=Heterorhabditis bacteriophora TaxID=37862 RepID=A0A1I7X2W8_HETBA